MSDNVNIAVLLGVGDGTFAAAMQYASGDGPLNGPRSVAIGDFNGDQVPDLVVTNTSDENVSLLLGVGNGTFLEAVPYATGDRPYSVAIGDLDGDQNLDLAVANYNGDSISILINRRPSPGDLDGDGDIDLGDFDLWANCLAGPDVVNPPPDCDSVNFALSDLDADEDVDLDDFAAFSLLFVGG